MIEAVGAWFYAVNTKRYLYLIRNNDKHHGTWSLPGGKQESGETLLESLIRECREEMNHWPECLLLTPLEQFTASRGRFVYHMFFAAVAHEFIPELNEEHFGWAWIKSGEYPRPLHPGLWSTFKHREVREKIQILESSFLK